MPGMFGMLSVDIGLVDGFFAAGFAAGFFADLVRDLVVGFTGGLLTVGCGLAAAPVAEGTGSGVVP